MILLGSRLPTAVAVLRMLAGLSATLHANAFEIKNDCDIQITVYAIVHEWDQDTLALANTSKQPPYDKCSTQTGLQWRSRLINDPNLPNGSRWCGFVTPGDLELCLPTLGVCEPIGARAGQIGYTWNDLCHASLDKR